MSDRKKRKCGNAGEWNWKSLALYRIRLDPHDTCGACNPESLQGIRGQRPSNMIPKCVLHLTYQVPEKMEDLEVLLKEFR